MSSSVEFTIAKLQQRIRNAEKKYHRKPHSVLLMAVSKTRSAAMIRQAYEAGAINIGENYLHEALEKQQQLQNLPLCWHFIGPIQSNKTRAIAEHFDWVHSIDRLKIAQRLNQQRPTDLAPLNICLQVNISNEPSKSGVALDQLSSLAEQVAQLNNLCLRGLMAIPEASDDFEQQRKNFAQLKSAATQLQHQHKSLDTLSIGMSRDMEAAIAEGATIVRIGSDIFGAR